MVYQQDYSKQKNVPLTADDVIIFTTYHIYYDFLAIALTQHVNRMKFYENNKG